MSHSVNNFTYHDAACLILPLVDIPFYTFGTHIIDLYVSNNREELIVVYFRGLVESIPKGVNKVESLLEGIIHAASITIPHKARDNVRQVINGMYHRISSRGKRDICKASGLTFNKTFRGEPCMHILLAALLKSPVVKELYGNFNFIKPIIHRYDSTNEKIWAQLSAEFQGF